MASSKGMVVVLEREAAVDRWEQTEEVDRDVET
jgi:hypothetical protein